MKMSRLVIAGYPVDTTTLGIIEMFRSELPHGAPHPHITHIVPVLCTVLCCTAQDVIVWELVGGESGPADFVTALKHIETQKIFTYSLGNCVL